MTKIKWRKKGEEPAKLCVVEARGNKANELNCVVHTTGEEEDEEVVQLPRVHFLVSLYSVREPSPQFIIPTLKLGQ